MTDSNIGKKNILLISYHFPPSTAVGGHRIFNFAKKLPLYGWNPTVLTIKDQYVESMDKERLEEIENINIVKTGKVPKIINIYPWVKNVYGHLLESKESTLNRSENDVDTAVTKASAKNDESEKVLQKFKRYFFSLLITLPDMEKNWVLPATLAAIREIKRKKYQVILTSCPPYSVHLIGLLVNKFTGIKWVADFRDPWMTTGSKQLYHTCKLSIKIESWMEKQVIKNASLVTTTTESLCDVMKKKIPEQPESKYFYLPNGYDPDVYSYLKNENKFNTFTLTYTGGLYLGRTPEPIFKAIRNLVNLEKLALQQINIKLVGNCRHVDGYPMENIVRSYGLEKVVEIVSPVPYKEANRIIRKSHLALLFAPNLPYQIPAKVYDYMGAGTRVLALAEEGATSNLVNTTKIGKSFRSTDIDGISGFICQSLKDMNTERSEHNGFVDGYKIEKLTEKLANHIGNI